MGSSHAGTASNRLGEYGSDMLDKMTRNVFEDRLNGTTVSTSHWEILNHTPGTEMPSIPNRTTNNPDKPRNYTVKNVTFNYNADIVDNPDVIAYGLIAEDVQAIPETQDLVNIGTDGLPESIAYDRINWYVIKAISQINDRLNKLEGK